MKTCQKLISLMITAAIAVVFTVGGSASAQQAQPKPWTVPANYKTMTSPVNLKDASVIATGKELWAKHCKSCHGAKGLGDGPKAATLTTHQGDFSGATFQGQKDGEIYYKTLFGRGEMPAYDKKIPDKNEQWSLVAFMRTMKK